MLIQVDESGYMYRIISNSDIILVFGSYEFLVRLEDKIRNDIFFCVNESNDNSVLGSVCKKVMQLYSLKANVLLINT